jgi:rod shape-determining protein MreD
VGSTLSFPILALAAILQTTVVPHLMRVLNAEPDLIFLIVLSWAIHAPLEQALVWALVGGIMADLLSSAPTGASVIGLVLMVGVVSILRTQVYSVGIFMMIALAGVGTIVHRVIYLLITTLDGTRPPIVSLLLLIMLPTLVYNLLLLFPIYRLTRFIQKRAGTGGITPPGAA